MPRPSPIRSAVKNLLSQSANHGLTLDQLKQNLQDLGLSPDFSSIYRAVNTLEKQGIIERVDLSDGKVRYEKSQQHHEHVRCNNCGEIAPVQGCLLESVFETVTETTGYQLSTHSLLLEGFCPNCQLSNNSVQQKTLR